MDRITKLFQTIFLSLITLALFSVTARAKTIKVLEGPEHHAPDRNFRTLHYTLRLSFDAPKKKAVGHEIISLVPFHSGMDSIVLDAAKMKIESVRLLPKTKLTFQKKPEHLIIHLNKPYGSSDTLKIAIDYSVEKPKKGLYFILPKKGSDKNHFEIYSQGEMEDNHYWFPCWDYPNDRSASDVYVTAKMPNIVISNGALVKVTSNEKDSTRTFHWKIDISHVSYLTSIVVGNYEKVEDFYKNIPVQYYVHPDQKKYARTTFGKTPEIIRFFSEKIGYDYPYTKYSQSVVDNFIYGGMENISATTLTAGTIRDRRSTIDGTSEGLIAHELAHQWWGDLLTCRNWTNSWLNEGFATYFASLWTEHSQGTDALDYKMRQAANSYIVEDSTRYRRTLDWYRYQYPVNMFDRHAYQKGAWVLHMMRYVLGDELFWKGLNHYAAINAQKLVEASDLKKAIEVGTGKNLYWFFNEWVYSGGYPKFRVKKSWIDSLKAVALHVQQTQIHDTLTTVFRMPVRIQLFAGGHNRTVKVDLNSADTTFYLKSRENPDLVLFDPGDHILKKIDFKKSKKERLLQLSQAEYAIDRLDALKALERSNKSDEDVQKAVARRLESDSFWVVRRDAARFLGSTKSDFAKQALVSAIHDPKSRVREAVISALGTFKDSSFVPMIQKTFRTDSSYYVLSACIRAIASIDSVKSLPFLKEALKMDSYNQTIRKAAIQAIGKLKTPDAIAIILPYGTTQYPATLRTSVLRTVAKLGKNDPRALRFAIERLKDPSNWVRKQAAFTLSRIGNPSVIEALRQAVNTEIDPRVKASMEIALKHLEAKKAIGKEKKE
ncbi:aminopeptidase N [bacterium BMS3Bbin03]|nr:aminopeptidase N [bacterium BMS3Bbin03]HDL78686.1 hypothetical protein [Bacteroidota bacterium]